MKKYLIFLFLFILLLSFSFFVDTKPAHAWDSGCSSAGPYSKITGHLCSSNSTFEVGCTATTIFNVITGKLCGFVPSSYGNSSGGGSSSGGNDTGTSGEVNTPPEIPTTVTQQGKFFENPTTQTYVCGSRAMDIYPYTTGDKQYAFMIDGCGIDVFDSETAKIITSVGLAPGVNGYLHYEYKLHHVAVLDDFPYGMASYSTEGWTVFKINKNSAGEINNLTAVEKYYVGDHNGSTHSDGMINAMGLFKIGNHAYLVSRYDMTPDDENYSTPFAIYDFGDGTSAPTLAKVAELLPHRSSTMYDIITDSTNTYLYVYSFDGVHIYDVTNPTVPTYLGLKKETGLAIVFYSGKYEIGVSHPRGTAYVPVAKRLYTLVANNFYIYDVTDPKNPVLKTSQVLPNGTRGVGSGIASDGSLLAVVIDKKRDNNNNVLPGSQMIYYYDVKGDQPQQIPFDLQYSTEWPFKFNNAQDVVIFLSQTGAYHVFHSHWMQAFWDKVVLGTKGVAPSSAFSPSSPPVSQSSALPPITPSSTAPGIFSASPTSCIIAKGENSCNVNLSWTITNSKGLNWVSANGMGNVSSKENSLTQSFTVPYNGRIFSLYTGYVVSPQVPVLLAQTTVAANCAFGTTWNGTFCSQ
jgi:hypothetical protein